MVKYAYTVRDKLSESTMVRQKIPNNSREQAILGDSPQALDGFYTR